MNTLDRNDVVSFWHAVYQASEGYEKRVAWTGNYSGKPGSTAGTFVDDVERRLNYFRAMAGVHTDAVVNSHSKVVVDHLDLHKPDRLITKADAAQDAALMMALNFDPTTGANPALSHNPLRSVKSWSAAAWNASAKGNFSFGLYGPGAITEYMVERHASHTATSPWNSLVGHRRWNLHPNATDFATGDVPGTSAYKPPVNVFYVVQHRNELRPEEVPNFVTYPSAGYFPAALNSPYWSLSYSGADFSGASVKMTDSAGRAIALTSVKANTDYGDPAIIWEVPSSVALNNVLSDTRFNVEVTGIRGQGVPTEHRYWVTLINPDRLLDNQNLSGSAKMSAAATGRFTFKAPARAESVQVVAARKLSTKWTENAENAAKAKIIVRTPANYSVITSPASIPGFGIMTGKNAFRLTFPTAYDLITRNVPDQIFEIDRDILPKSKAKFTFDYRRGYMTTGSVLAVEISSNGGLTWKAIGSPIKGNSNTAIQVKGSKASLALPKSSTPLRVRFRYYTTGGGIYTHESAKTAPTGIFIDNISVTNCDWLETKKITALSPSSTAFSFSSKTAGMKLQKGVQWHLRLRSQVGGKWFHYGNSKTVSITK